MPVHRLNRGALFLQHRMRCHQDRQDRHVSFFHYISAQI
jgi:hypothetical protein